MAKNKLARFRENLTFPYLHQPTFDSVWRAPYPLQGQWAAQQFSNQNPITLELGCGRGEYTVALAQAAPEQNYIGMDIKGARLWVGARAVKEQGLPTSLLYVPASKLLPLFLLRTKLPICGLPSQIRNSRNDEPKNALRANDF